MRLIPLLLILSACTVAGPGFRGIDPVPRSLGGNDFLRGLAPEAMRDNLDGILDKADAAGIEALL